MATREEDLISQAIASTENEIFGEAFGQKEPVLDETGDRSIEQMGEGLEGQHEPDEDEPDSDDEPEDGEESEGEDEGENGEDEGEEDGEDEGEEGDGEDQQEDEAEPETDKPPEKETKPEGRVPSGRLREQTERADRAETALRTANEDRERERAEFNRRFDDMNGRFNTLMTALQGGQRPGAPPQPQPQGAQPDAPPDVFENPQGFVEYQNRQRQSDMSRVEQMFANMRFQNSVDIARSIHKEKFDAAWDAVNKLSADKPDELAVARQIYNAPNPGAEIMKWHARSETLRLVGDDPAKYRETVSNEIRESLMKDPEFRKQLLDNLRAEATGDNDSKPKRTITRLPKSLNGATGQSHQKDSDPTLYDDSDAAVFNSAWR